MHHNDDNAGIVKYKYSSRNRHPTNHVKASGTRTGKTELLKIKNFVLASEPNQKIMANFSHNGSILATNVRHGKRI